MVTIGDNYCNDLNTGKDKSAFYIMLPMVQNVLPCEAPQVNTNCIENVVLTF